MLKHVKQNFIAEHGAEAYAEWQAEIKAYCMELVLEFQQQQQSNKWVIYYLHIASHPACTSNTNVLADPDVAALAPLDDHRRDLATQSSHHPQQLMRRVWMLHLRLKLVMTLLVMMITPPQAVAVRRFARLRSPVKI